MADFPAMPLWTDALVGDTTHLTTLEFGAYMKLLIAAWRTRRCCLPRDNKMLARYAGLTTQQWARIEKLILPFFEVRYRNGEYLLFQKKQRKIRASVLKKSRVQKKRRLGKTLKPKETPKTGDKPGSDQPKPKPKPKEERKKDTYGISSKPNGFDTGPFVAAWNEICGGAGLSRVTVLRDQRKQKAAKRWREDFGESIERWGEFCRKVAASDFLAGRKADWKANFDWCIEPRNLIKINEGNYDNGDGHSGDPTKGAARILGARHRGLAVVPFPTRFAAGEDDP